MDARGLVVACAVAAGVVAYGSMAEALHGHTASAACSHSSGHEQSSGNGATDVHASEHASVLALVPDCDATSVAVRSGPWSDPRTWRGGLLPGGNARVVVPKDVSVVLDLILDHRRFDWVRVDGRLAFHPGQDTTLKARTLVVSGTGTLEIGAPDAPLRHDVRAQIVFAPRAGRDRQRDPYDLAGGLISQGAVRLVGARKTAHAGALAGLGRGAAKLEFAAPLAGWRLGDQVLIPGVDPRIDEDEVRSVVQIAQDARSVDLDHPLAFDHRAPDGVSIPVANLTRNIVLRSLAAGSTTGRGHVMFMHAHSGTLIDGVAFLDLGRTDARFAHTFPAVAADGRSRPGSDANSIGRYAVHFHVRSGGRVDLPPNIVRNSVVIDSPKYGIVNHGGHLLAEDNVTFRVVGSHFVGENGSEVGAFRRNVAVRATGSRESAIENRMTIYDFGHGGHGFWLQGPGVEVTDNWASGHAQAGIFSMGMPFKENGREIFFNAKNIGNPKYVEELGDGRIRTSDVSFRFARNVVAASHMGMEIWYHKLYATHREPSEVEGLVVWNTAGPAVSLAYASKVRLRNLRLMGSNRVNTPGILSNEFTESISIEDSEIRDFSVGMRLPERGRNLVRNATLANHVDMYIPIALVAGRRIRIERVRFGPKDGDDRDIVMQGTAPRFADLALMFEDDRIEMAGSDGRDTRLFFPFQHPAAIPVPDDGPAAIKGLTSAEIQRRFGLSAGGMLAPAKAMRLPRSNALAATLAHGPDDFPAQPLAYAEIYPGQIRHFDANDKASKWKVLLAAGAAETPEGGVSGAKYMLRRGLLPLEIHPDDISHGYRFSGVLLERVGATLVSRSYSREFRDLRAGADGFVRIRFELPDLAGRMVPFEIALRVSPEAIRRGGNIDFWAQSAYCGKCGLDTLDEDAERFFTTGQLDPMPQLSRVCRQGRDSAVVLRRPFRKEDGHAFVSMLPALSAMGDRSDVPRGSPYLLCEGDRVLGEPHTLHDEIRRSAGGGFSHWGDRLYFSTSDGSNPNTNGRDYFLVLSPATGRSTAERLPGSASALVATAR